VSGAGKKYLLAPIVCQHAANSRKLIEAAAARVAPGRVAVLGAGACSEIPLAALTARFQRAVLCDSDRPSMEQGVEQAELSASQRAKLTLVEADLTGMVEPLLEEISTILAGAADPATAIDQIAAALEAAPAGKLPLDGKFDLIVASCLLSQLHVRLTHAAEALFAQRFADQAGMLRASPRFSETLEVVARRMEAVFLDELLRHLGPGGLIYLSESVQMCFLEHHPTGQWQTEGTYRMLRTRDLVDYVDARFEVAGQARWQWVVWPPDATGKIGRLFDVQALLLAGRASSDR